MTTTKICKQNSVLHTSESEINLKRITNQKLVGHGMRKNRNNSAGRPDAKVFSEEEGINNK